MEKTQKHKIQNYFEIGPEFVPPFSLESSMKRILGRFEWNQNKSKQMKINDRFTSKAYSATILNRTFNLHQL